MADNPTLPLTEGATIQTAADDIGGILYQRVKPSFGVDGSAVDVSATNPLPVTEPLTGVGSLALIPSGSTNGTIIGTKPANARGVRMYLASGDVVTYAIVSAAPSSAPITFTITGVTGGSIFDETLNGQDIYITSITGTPKFRWM